MGRRQVSQLWIIGLSTFSPINSTLCVHFRRTMGSGGPRVIVVNLGASNCDMSVSMSTGWEGEKELVLMKRKETLELTLLYVLHFLCCGLRFDHFHGLHRCNKTCLSYLRRLGSRNRNRNFFVRGCYNAPSSLSSTRSPATTSSTPSTTTFTIRVHRFNAPS